MQLRKAVDNLYLYDPQFEPASQQHLAEVGGSSDRQQIARWRGTFERCGKREKAVCNLPG